jgi:hypothetical protein
LLWFLRRTHFHRHLSKTSDCCIADAWRGGKMPGMEDRPPLIPDYADAQIGKWIVIAQFPDEITAHLASSKLDAAGIQTILGNQLNPIGGNVSTGISVQSGDVEAAITILTDSPAKRWLVGQ